MVELRARAATAQSIGTRTRQEDAVVACSSQDGGPALAVLSDGMGGHEDGDLASRIIASEMFGEIFVAAARLATLSQHSANVFRAALNCANTRLQQHIEAGRLSQNTGGTLVCATVLEGKLRWLSVGDSFLYVYRAGTLLQLNEIHSLGAQLDQMVEGDLMDVDAARTHPDRHCLTSAVTGGDIPKIDCPDHAFDLEADDIVILASDGIDVLTQNQICCIVEGQRHSPSATIARTLLDEVRREDDPDQDNTSVIAIRMEPVKAGRPGHLARIGQHVSTVARQSRLRLSPPRLRP